MSAPDCPACWRRCQGLLHQPPSCAGTRQASAPAHHRAASPASGVPSSPWAAPAPIESFFVSLSAFTASKAEGMPPGTFCLLLLGTSQEVVNETAISKLDLVYIAFEHVSCSKHRLMLNKIMTHIQSDKYVTRQKPTATCRHELLLSVQEMKPHAHLCTDQKLMLRLQSAQNTSYTVLCFKGTRKLIQCESVSE